MSISYATVVQDLIAASGIPRTKQPSTMDYSYPLTGEHPNGFPLTSRVWRFAPKLASGPLNRKRSDRKKRMDGLPDDYAALYASVYASHAAHHNPLPYPAGYHPTKSATPMSNYGGFQHYEETWLHWLFINVVFPLLAGCGVWLLCKVLFRNMGHGNIRPHVYPYAEGAEEEASLLIHALATTASLIAGLRSLIADLFHRLYRLCHALYRIPARLNSYDLDGHGRTVAQNLRIWADDVRNHRLRWEFQAFLRHYLGFLNSAGFWVCIGAGLYLLALLGPEMKRRVGTVQEIEWQLPIWAQRRLEGSNSHFVRSNVAGNSEEQAPLLSRDEVVWETTLVNGQDVGVEKIDWRSNEETMLQTETLVVTVEQVRPITTTAEASLERKIERIKAAYRVPSATEGKEREQPRFTPKASQKAFCHVCKQMHCCEFPEEG